VKNLACRLALICSSFALFSPLAFSQQTTNTNCTTVGADTNCTSTTTDYGAQQQRAYEQGQKVGDALGRGISSAMQTHSFNKGLKKYCDAHPGQEWHYTSRSDGHLISTGHCPSDTEKALEAVYIFMSKHKDFMPGDENATEITTYIESNRLDPREEKSYESAYKALKKEGKLKLYSR